MIPYRNIYIGEYIWRFLAMANPCQDNILSDTPPLTNVPTISGPKAPNLKGNDVWKYIEDHW